jgi:anhydro-N-acetylmuramic acid kinase
MATHLRLDTPHGAYGQRTVVGVLISSKCTEVAAALVGTRGHGLDAEVDACGAVAREVPKETTALFGRLAHDGSCPAVALALLRAQLAEIQAALVTELLQSARVPPGSVLAVGVHDPGLWGPDGSHVRGYLGLCDAARLAESTGLNVIDAFPARDLAQGGLGGPITAVAQWVLLRHPAHSRVLLDLGRTVRMTYLPSYSPGHNPPPADGSATERAASRILSFEVGPGTRLLDLLAERLTDGEHHFDPGGRLAVQGRRIEELVDHWLADPYFNRPLPRWHPRGVRPERFLTDSLQMAVKSGWSVQDLLCSATHFIAETIKRALCRQLPEDDRIDEIVLSGGGQQNGLLLREIAHAAQLPLVRVGELGTGDEALGPALIAVLALLYLDQVPANQTAVTRTEVPRPLGRLTPGSPQHWQRLLQTTASGNLKLRPFRSAL